MTAVSDRLDRIEADVAVRGDNEWYIAPTPADFAWLLDQFRRHQATLEQIAATSTRQVTHWATIMRARERLREGEGE